jgi:hypothetical protein
MVLIGQAVDHRNARMAREAINDVLLEGADHDQVDHARDHLGYVLDRLAPAQLRVPRVEVDGGTAELRHAGLERYPRAGGILLEDHRQRAPCQRLVALPAALARLELGGTAEQVFELAALEVAQLQEVAHGGARAGGAHRRCPRRARFIGARAQHHPCITRQRPAPRRTRGSGRRRSRPACLLPRVAGSAAAADAPHCRR